VSIRCLLVLSKRNFKKTSFYSCLFSKTKSWLKDIFSFYRKTSFSRLLDDFVGYKYFRTRAFLSDEILSFWRADSLEHSKTKILIWICLDYNIVFKLKFINHRTYISRTQVWQMVKVLPTARALLTLNLHPGVWHPSKISFFFSQSSTSGEYSIEFLLKNM